MVSGYTHVFVLLSVVAVYRPFSLIFLLYVPEFLKWTSVIHSIIVKYWVVNTASEMPCTVPGGASINQSIDQTNYFIVRLKVYQRAGQISLPHLGIVKLYSSLIHSLTQ